MLFWGREPGVVVRAMGMPGGKAVAPLDRGARLPVSTNAAIPPIAPNANSFWRQDLVDADPARLGSQCQGYGLARLVDGAGSVSPANRVGVDFDLAID